MTETRLIALVLLLATAIDPRLGAAAAAGSGAAARGSAAGVPSGARLLAPAPTHATAVGFGEAEAPPSESRLVILGGGERAAEALARFVLWAGGPSSRILAVSWASIEPKESCSGVLEELRPHAPGEASCAPFAPLDARGKAGHLDPGSKTRFLQELAVSTGVFFTGGDQARIMDVLSDAELLRAVRERHAQGTVFGGTSAGAAVMSLRMIADDGDPTVIDADQVVVREGLGLLPGVIVDQHFVKRQRENRLFGLVLRHPNERGIGIDQDTALLVTGGRHAEVVGRGPVLLVDAVGPDKLEVTILRPGQSVDLQLRR